MSKDKKQDVFTASVVESSTSNIKANENLGVSQEYDRQKYIDAKKMNNYRKNSFQKSKVYDSVTKKRLYPDQESALKHHVKPENLKSHVADVDHNIPIKKIYDKNKNNPFITDDDIKCAANKSGNYIDRSQTSNRSKNSKTPTEWLDKERESGVNINKKAYRKERLNEYRSKASVGAAVAGKTVKSIGIEAIDGARTAIEESSVAIAFLSLSNIIQVCNGTKSKKDAAFDISKSLIAIGGTGAATRIIKDAFGKSDNEIIKKLLENNLPAKIVSTVLLIKDDIAGVINKTTPPETAASNISSKLLGIKAGSSVAAALSGLPFGLSTLAGAGATVIITETAKNLFDEVAGHGAWEQIKNSSGKCQETATYLLNAVNKMERDNEIINLCINNVQSGTEDLKNLFQEFNELQRR